MQNVASFKPTHSQSVDLVEILERDVYPQLTPEQVYNWAGHDFKRSGNRLRGNPPWGQSKSGTSFTAFDDLGFLDSHNGGETGDPIKYRYSLKTGAYAYPKVKDWIETVKELFNLAGVTFPEREWTPQQIKHAQRRESRQAILQAVQEYCAALLWTARGEAERKHLIEERGFTEQGLKEFGIGLYPAGGEIKQVLQAKKLDIELAQQIGVLAKKWEGYMIFPWANSYGQPLTLYGHQSKACAEATGKPKKYALFNPKDEEGAWLHTKESPYFLDRAIRERHKELVLVEGITDAAIAHQQGDTRVIACVAAMLSKQQCETLKRHRIERVIIALDPDAAGDAGIDSCIKSLSEVDISAYVALKLPCGLDPDEYILEYGIDTWKSLTKAAIHGYRWKAERILESGDLTTDSGKEAVLNQAIAYARSQKDKLSLLQLHFLPTLAGGLGMDIKALREALERLLGGNGGGDGGNGEDKYWGDGSGAERNTWNSPVVVNGEIGWLVLKEEEEDSIPQFFPKCNFDFVVERELESEDGGGLVLAVKRSLDRHQKRVILSSVDYGRVIDFEVALKKAYGTGIVCNLKPDQLKNLIHCRLREYRDRGGEVYRLIDRYGQQPDGVWVFRDRQFKPDGTPTNEEESGWVFNPSLGKEDFIPCPELAPEDPDALKRLVDNCHAFFGEKNIYQVLITMGWVIASIHSQEIFRHDNCFPLINPNGEPGACKTLACEAGLSLVGSNWAQMGMLAKVSTSALYEHGARTAGLPFMLDDPERSNELDEIFKTWYNWKPRRVRGNDQQPKSPLGAITNHVVGADQAATFTRFVRLTYERASGGNKQAFQELRKAQEAASGAFPLLLKIGYDPDAIAALERELLPHLPLAHARIAQSLAIPLYYAKKLIEMTGYDYDLTQWVIENCCAAENDSDNSADSLQDFTKNLLSLESESLCGSWNFKRDVERDDNLYIALFAAEVWKLVDRHFKPATYNFKSLKPLVLKAGGIIDTTVRFDRDRDSVLAYERAKITADTQDSEPTPPETQPRKAWLIPSSFFDGNNPFGGDSPLGGNNPAGGDNPPVTGAVTGVTGCNRISVTTSNDDSSRVSALSEPSCNCVTEKIDIDIEKREGELSTSDEEIFRSAPENPGYSGYTVTEQPVTTIEQGLQAVTEISTTSVTKSVTRLQGVSESEREDREVAASQLTQAAHNLCDNNQGLEKKSERSLAILRKIPIVVPVKKSEATATGAEVVTGVASEEVPEIKSTSPASALASAPEKGIRVGSRVRYLGKGSQRYGMVGIVKSIAGSIASIWLDYRHDLRHDLRKLEAALSQLELVE